MLQEFGRQQTYHQSSRDTGDNIAEIANTKDSVKAYVELTDPEKVRPLPEDLSEQGELATRIHEAESNIPMPLFQELAHMFLASGTASSVLQLQQLKNITGFQVADMWDCMCSPLTTPTDPALGVEDG